MARKPGGPHSARGSTVLAVRVPNDVLDAAVNACGNRAKLAEWLRNLIRQACQIPIDYETGYDEGHRAGWAAANEKFKAALRSGGE